MYPTKNIIEHITRLTKNDSKINILFINNALEESINLAIGFNKKSIIYFFGTIFKGYAIGTAQKPICNKTSQIWHISLNLIYKGHKIKDIPVDNKNNKIILGIINKVIKFNFKPLIKPIIKKTIKLRNNDIKEFSIQLKIINSFVNFIFFIIWDLAKIEFIPKVVDSVIKFHNINPNNKDNV